MSPEQDTPEQETGYRIWAADNVVYGPVELPSLVAWIKDARVTADTWVFSEAQVRWSKAAALSELSLFFRHPASAASAADEAVSSAALKGLDLGVLRRVKLLASFTDEQLTRLVQSLEVLSIRQWSVVVKQGDNGDAMFMVLGGELRVRLLIDGHESILATLGPGDFFGEISLFDQGPRSADIVANVDSILLKVSAGAFDKLMEDAPDVAARFLLATTRTLTTRIRADNKRYRDSIHIARAAR